MKGGKTGKVKKELWKNQQVWDKNEKTKKSREIFDKWEKMKVKRIVVRKKRKGEKMKK